MRTFIAGSMDDSGRFDPQADIHVAHAHPWETLDPETPKFDGYPSV